MHHGEGRHESWRQARNLTHSRTSSRPESPPPASRLLEPADLDPFGLDGGDVGDGALLAGEAMPEPSAYLSATQRDGQPLLAGELYRETWAWLDARGVASFVSPR